ncbi:hypothetical protein C8R43DRAFT_1122319 [Mycena crocata]|nr:hypothetical protein C8R43DRAFT_1122319 [Mycena crocata]
MAAHSPSPPSISIKTPPPPACRAHATSLRPLAPRRPRLRFSASAPRSHQLQASPSRHAHIPVVARHPLRVPTPMSSQRVSNRSDDVPLPHRLGHDPFAVNAKAKFHNILPHSSRRGVEYDCDA